MIIFNDFLIFNVPSKTKNSFARKRHEGFDLYLSLAGWMGHLSLRTVAGRIIEPVLSPSLVITYLVVLPFDYSIKPFIRQINQKPPFRTILESRCFWHHAPSPVNLILRASKYLSTSSVPTRTHGESNPGLLSGEGVMIPLHHGPARSLAPPVYQKVH